MFPADDDLARREPDLVGLPLVLDAAALRDRLAAIVPGLLDVRVSYVRYKPGTSIVASMELRTQHGPSYGLAATYPVTSAHPKLGKVPDVGPWAPVVDRRLGLVLAPAEADRKLPGVRAVTTRCSVAGSQLDAVRPLRYNPIRRWVGVGERAGEPHRLVKVHRPDATPALIARQRTVEAAGVPVPPLAGFRSRFGLITLSWIPGLSLDQLPAQEHLAPLGELLAQLHRADPPRGGSPRGGFQRGAGDADGDATGDAPSLYPAVRAIARLTPELTDPARAVANACERHLRARPTPASTLVHGDLSADQVIAAPDRLWLTDLDQVRVGDPAADLGSYLAAEVAAGRAGPCSAPSTILTPLLAGYHQAGGSVDLERVAGHAAAGLLRRAIEPFRLRQPDWPARIGTLVEAARTMTGMSR